MIFDFMASNQLFAIETTMRKTFLAMLVFLSSSMASAGDPALPGNHPLTQVQSGSLLISELRCAACHTDIARNSIPEKTAPDLAEVGTRVTSEYLQKFLASPLTAHPGTTMPDVLGARPESERKKMAEAMTHFLIAQSTSAASFEPLEPTGPLDRTHGKELFHSVGCIACHGPKESASDSQKNPKHNSLVDDEDEEEAEDPARAASQAIKPLAVPLEHVATKYSVTSLSEFLFQPLRVRSSGRMPDMKLTPSESFAIAGYLVGVQPEPRAPLIPDATLVSEGKKHFQELNCAACHSLKGIEAAPPVGSFVTSDLTTGCLSNEPWKKSNDRSPRFALDDNQRQAMVAAIREDATIQRDTAIDSDQVALAKTLTVFRCVACHGRDDYGGVHDAYNSFFKGSEMNLGDDGRIPPPLTLMGAKLKPSWMKKVLFDGESVRHYMVTRMPQYGSANLQHLPNLFRRLDVLDGPQMNIPSPDPSEESERQKEKLIRSAGRELIGDKGANCVACHPFNGKAANVNQGIDLLTSFERLQPEWFHRYLRNPGAFRPRTVMPTAWPDGVAAFNTILEGSTDRQIEAIWYYLSLGTSAADPSGVRAVSTKIQVGDRAMVHRGRSRIAGFRGIAVGFPERLSYAFNAETGTLSAIWQGDFIGVNWSGQGAGDFNPASEPITLPQDVSFTALENENASWPLLPVMTKEQPTNPNPLYPKNVGYQFRGYFQDKLSIPTFQYRSGTIEIEDRSTVEGAQDQQRLQRVLQFQSPTPQVVWFRALVGAIHRESDQVFRSGRLRLKIPAAETELRSLSNDPTQFELLLRLDIPQGKSSLELLYEPLKK
jgi:mono/diheme cytochrome c family protein